MGIRERMLHVGTAYMLLFSRPMYSLSQLVVGLGEKLFRVEPLRPLPSMAGGPAPLCLTLAP